jgi:heptosyltransferase-2
MKKPLGFKRLFYYFHAEMTLQPNRDIRRILVSRLRFMGDVLLTLPAVRALKAAYPSARITYLTQHPYQELLENHPDIDEVLVLDTKRLWPQIRLLRRFMSGRYDISVDLFGNPRSALWMRLSGARMRIGGDFRGRRMHYTHRIRNDGKPKTAAEFHLSYLKPLGIPLENSEPEIFLTPEEKDRARDWLNAQGAAGRGPLIGLHAGASWPAKRWFPERFAALADRLRSELGASILWTEGPGEAAILDVVRKSSRGPIRRSGVLPLRSLAAVLGECDVFVSNDCGPMHLAPAVGTKTVGIFGPGEPEIWFPYNQAGGHRFIHANVDCSRCHMDVCGKMDCMKAVSVEDVFNAVKASLGSHKP